MTRPTVLIVDSSIAMTGGFRAASNAAKALAGHAEIILALPTGTTIDPAEFAPFKRVVRLPIRTIRRSARDLALYLPALLSSSFALRRILRREATHFFINDFVLMHGAVLRRLGYRGFIGAWVRMNPAAFPARLSRFFLHQVWRSSDRIIAVSRHAMAAVPAAAHLCTIYDPVAPPTHASRSAAGGPILVYVANIIVGKGQEHAIAAFARIADRYRHAELHFWGGDMGLEKNRAFGRKLMAQAAAAGIGDRVRFRGYASDVYAVLAGATVALNFSESETLSLTCIEASLARVPVIATRCGGPEEIVVDGETGYLVDRGDVAAMAERMARLLGDQALAQLMGEAGARVAKQIFSPDRFRVAFLNAIARPEALQ